MDISQKKSIKVRDGLKNCPKTARIFQKKIVKRYEFSKKIENILPWIILVALYTVLPIIFEPFEA